LVGEISLGNRVQKESENNTSVDQQAGGNLEGSTFCLDFRYKHGKKARQTTSIGKHIIL